MRAAQATIADWARVESGRSGGRAAASVAGSTCGRLGDVDDDGVRRQVAQALEVGPEQHRQQPGGIEKGQEIGGAQQVADERGRRRHRQAVVHQHPQSDGALARRRAPGRQLEQHRVEPLEGEEHDQEDAEPELAEQAEDDGDGEQQGDADREVDREGGAAGDDAGRRQGEGDALGRLDAVAQVEQRLARPAAGAGRPRRAPPPGPAVRP